MAKNNNNKKYDIDAIRNRVDLVDIIGAYVPLKKNGREYQACCPFHDEKTPSFAVVPEKGFYHCFGCGAHGDVFDFVMDLQGVDFAGACEILGGDTAPGDAQPKKKRRKKAVDPYAGIEPILVNGQTHHLKPNTKTPELYNPKRADDPQKRFTRYTPSMVFPYKTDKGALIGYVVRVDINEKTKITPTLQYCQLADGTKAWTHMPFAEPRPLYGLQRLATNPDKPVMLLEGEKPADAGHRLVGGDYVVMAWPLGTNGRHKVDWSPLAGRRVLVCPDMDQPGVDAALGNTSAQGEWRPGVCEYLLDAGAAEVAYVDIDTSKEKGWDLADAERDGWTKKQVYDWVGSFKKTFVKPEKKPARRKPSKGEKGPQEPPPVDAYADGEAAPGEWRHALQRSDSGAIKPFVSNIVLILSNDDALRDGLAYCDLSYRIIKRRPLLPHMAKGEWTDADTSHLLNYLGLEHKFDPGDKKVIQALIVAAQRRRFHPIRDYLNGLVWDGKPRLDYWLVHAFDALAKNEDQAAGYKYLAKAGRYFLIGAVARAMSPPCKMDNVLIFEGSQGKGKSTAVAELFGDWFSDSPVPIGNKDAYQVIQGTWCCELAELDSFNKVESTQAKQFFSSKTDRYRPSYGRMAEDFHRQCVFVGTTNQDEYLKDYTGNRRYWPVYCKEVNVKAIRAMRDQLWAEAMHWYQAGVGAERNEETRWWPVEGEDLALFIEEQDARMQIDSWHHMIEDYLYKFNPDHVQSSELLISAIGKDGAHHTKADQNRIAPIMKALGWVNVKKRIDIQGSSTKQPRHVYVKPRDWNPQRIETQPFPDMDGPEL